MTNERTMMIYLCLLFSIITLIRTGTSGSVIPAKIVVGLNNGQINSCLLNSLEVCTALNHSDQSVMRMDIFDGHVYAGLRYGDFYKCKLDVPESCEQIMKSRVEYSIAVIRGVSVINNFVYVAEDTGKVYRCGLNKPCNCSEYKYIYSDGNTDDNFYSFGFGSLFTYERSAVSSMIATHEYFYFGLDNGRIMVCHFEGSDPCWELFQTSSRATGLAVSGNYLFIGLLYGIILRYDLEKQEKEYEIYYRAPTGIYSLVAHGDYIYAGMDTNRKNYEMRRCPIDAKDNCSVITAFQSPVFTIAMTYESKEMDPSFKGEEIACIRQNRTTCSHVDYYDSERRSVFELFVKDGKIYNRNGDLFDTKNADVSHSGKRAIFVMDPTGRIYASNTHAVYQFHESSFLAGGPAAAAGELVVDRGVIKTITNCSGHYRPSLDLMEQVISVLKIKGYKEHLTVTDCSELELQIDLNYNDI